MEYVRGALLVDEHPLIVLPTLAKIIGVNEAIVLQQIHFWTTNHERVGINYHDGEYWVYNSYEQWHSDNFSFWSKSTVINIINRLEERDLLISGNYNKKSFDRTKWYRVNYDKLLQLYRESKSK